MSSIQKEYSRGNLILCLRLSVLRCRAGLLTKVRNWELAICGNHILAIHMSSCPPCRLDIGMACPVDGQHGKVKVLWYCISVAGEDRLDATVRSVVTKA